MYQVVVLLVLNFYGDHIPLIKGGNLEHETKVKNTLIFNTFVICQVILLSVLPTTVFLKHVVCLGDDEIRKLYVYAAGIQRIQCKKAG